MRFQKGSSYFIGSQTSFMEFREGRIQVVSGDLRGFHRVFQRCIRGLHRVSDGCQEGFIEVKEVFRGVPESFRVLWGIWGWEVLQTLG